MIRQYGSIWIATVAIWGVLLGMMEFHIYKGSLGVSMCIVILMLAFWGWLKKDFRIMILVLSGAVLLVANGLYWNEEKEYEKLSHFFIGQTATFFVSIDSTGVLTEGIDTRSIRYEVKLKEIHYGDGDAREGNGRAYFYIDEKNQRLYQIGQQLWVKGKIVPFRKYQNPGHINLSYRRKGAGVIGTLYREPGSVITEVGKEESVQGKLQEIQGKISDLLRKGLPEEKAMLLSSLLFGGNYDRLNPRVVDDFATTGIIHILSVSGSHVAMLFSVVFLIGRAMRVNRYMQCAISIFVVLVYATLTGWVPPVVRAFVMGTAGIVAIVFHRKFLGLHWLGLVVLFMVLHNPYIIADISFQLSVGATLGITLFYLPLVEVCRKNGIGNKWIASLLSISISAQVFIIPFILYYFHALPMYVALGNLLVAPILEWTIVGGLLGLVISAIWMPIGQIILSVVGDGIYFAVWVNSWIAKLPGATWSYRGLTIWEVGIYYTIICWWIWERGVNIARARKTHYMMVGTIFLLLFSINMVKNSSDSLQRIIIPDIGTGTIVLIENKGHFLLYYNEGERASMSAYREAKSVLEYLGVRKVDVCIYDTSPKFTLQMIPVTSANIIVRGSNNDTANVRMASGELVSVRGNGDGFIWRSNPGVIIGREALEIVNGESTCVIARNTLRDSITGKTFLAGTIWFRNLALSENVDAVILPSNLTYRWDGGEYEDGMRLVASNVYKTREGMLIGEMSRGGWKITKGY